MREESVLAPTESASGARSGVPALESANIGINVTQTNSSSRAAADTLCQRVECRFDAVSIGTSTCHRLALVCQQSLPPTRRAPAPVVVSQQPSGEQWSNSHSNSLYSGAKDSFGRWSGSSLDCIVGQLRERSFARDMVHWW